MPPHGLADLTGSTRRVFAAGIVPAIGLLLLTLAAPVRAQVCPDSPGYLPPFQIIGGGAPVYAGPAGGGNASGGPAGGGTPSSAGNPADPSGGANHGGTTPTPPPPGSSPGQSGGASGYSGGGRAAGPVTGPQPAGGRSPGSPQGGRTKKGGEVPDTWVTWWNYNKYELMNVRRLMDRSGGCTLRSAMGGDDGVLIDSELRQTQIVPVLGRVLRHDKLPLSRLAAAIALGKTGEAAAFGSLLPALHDGDVTVERAAALGLGLLSRPEAMDVLTALLEDTPAGRAAVNTDDAPVPDWVREGAALGLGFMPDHRAAPTLLRMLEGHQPLALEVFVVQALGMLGDRTVVGALISRLANDTLDARLRSACAIALGKIGDGSALVRQVLLGALGDRSNEVNRAAIIALGLVTKGEDATVVKALSTTVDAAADQTARSLALIALGRIGGPEAMGICRDKLPRRGAMTGYAPIALALAARTAVERAQARESLTLSSTMASSNDARGAHCIAFGLLRDRSRAVELLRLAQGGSDPELRSYALEGLAMIGTCDDPRALIRLLMEEKSPRVRHAAALAVGACGLRRDAINGLVSALDDSSSYVRGACSLALGFVGDRSTARHLLDIATRYEASPYARASAACALGLLCDRDDVPLFQRLRASNLVQDEFPELRDVMFLL